MNRPTRPLCPYCYRRSCPWLDEYERSGAPGMHDVCPFYDAPLPKKVRQRLSFDLVRSVGVTQCTHVSPADHNGEQFRCELESGHVGTHTALAGWMRWLLV